MHVTQVLINEPMQIRDDVQKAVKREYKEFVALVYQSQVVSGANYHIKVSATRTKVKQNPLANH